MTPARKLLVALALLAGGVIAASSIWFVATASPQQLVVASSMLLYGGLAAVLGLLLVLGLQAWGTYGTGRGGDGSPGPLLPAGPLDWDDELDRLLAAERDAGRPIDDHVRASW